MPKGKSLDAAKERRWRQVLADWQATGLSGAEYCRQKDLVYTQFNDWRKRVRKLDAALVNSSPHRQRMAGRAQGLSMKLQQEQKAQRAVEFAEVQLVEREHQAAAVPKTEDAATLEAIFPNGTKLRISAGCPINFLSSVVNILENR